MKRLHVQGRYLVWENGEPFFYLGDTAWELFHVLNREETEHYFKERNRQGFTAVQAVALSELEGLTKPNAYGRLPLLFTEGQPDPLLPDTEGDDSYWNHVDFAVETAAKYEMFIVMLPTWGDKFHRCWGKGPEIFHEENAYIYGQWIANRYKEHWNIIWMLGGDRKLEQPHRKIIDAMAAGIRSVDKHHLITFHPPGAQDSTDFLADAAYIDFHTAQTSHSIDRCYQIGAVMQKMADASEKPYLDSEPRYEAHPACFDASIGYFWDAADVRQNAYWSVLAGACGHTYGNHAVWSMMRTVSDYFPYTWEQALCQDGAEQMGYVKQLRLRRDYVSLQPAPELLVGNYEGMGYMTAARGDGYAYVYAPLGAPFTVDLEMFNGTKCVRGLWFNPRTGIENVFGIFKPGEKTLVVPPSMGKGQDWVLVLEEKR